MTLSQLLGSTKQRWRISAQWNAYGLYCELWEEERHTWTAGTRVHQNPGCWEYLQRACYLLLFAREILSQGRDRTKLCHSRCWRGGKRGSLYKLRGPGGPERVPEPNWVAYVLIFLVSIICRLCKLTLSDQDLVTLQLSVSLSDFSVNVCSRSAALVTQNGMFVSWLGSGKLIT